MLRSIKQRKKIRPAGTTLHANDSLPTSDSSWCFVLLGFLGSVKDWSSIKIANLRSSEMLAVIAMSITMPKKVICVVGVLPSLV